MHPVPRGIFGWLYPIYETDEVKETDKLGIDATMFLRVAMFLAQFAVFMAVFELPLMIITFYAKKIDLGSSTVGTDIFQISLNRISIQNINSGSNLFYIHVALAYLYSFVAYYMLYNLWIKYIVLKQQYFKSPSFKEELNNRVIVFTAVPSKLATADAMNKFLQDKGIGETPEQIMVILLDLPRLELTIQIYLNY
jgi:hypothetical protein